MWNGFLANFFTAALLVNPLHDLVYPKGYLVIFIYHVDEGGVQVIHSSAKETALNKEKLKYPH